MVECLNSVIHTHKNERKMTQDTVDTFFFLVAKFDSF